MIAPSRAVFELKATSSTAITYGFVGVAVTVFALCAGSIAYGHDSLDDPCITYRYARHLSQGLGLIWNAGEAPVEGYTTFLWAVLHAPFIAAGFSPLLVSKVASFASGCALIGLVFSRYNLAVRTTTWRSVLALSIALCPVLLFYAQSGMEHFFFLSILSAAILSWAASRLTVRRRSYLIVASTLFGISAITRPEGVMLFAVTVVIEGYERWRSRETMWNEWICYLLPFVAIWAPYFAWRIDFYGHLFPNTYYAKHSGNRGEHLVLGVQYLAAAFPSYFLPPLAIACGIALAPRRHEVRLLTHAESERERLVPLLLSLAAVQVLYVLWMGGDDASAFPSCRLLAPALPLVWLALSINCEASTRDVSPWRRRGLAAAVLALCVLAWLPDSVRLFRIANPAFRSTTPLSEILATTLNKAATVGQEHPGELSEWVREVTTPDALVALPWAGRVPYYSERPTLDILGLNDAHIAHLPSPPQRGHDVKMDPDYVLARRPQIIFVNVDKCFWQGACSFEDAGGWKLGDRRLLELLRHRDDYSFEHAGPGTVSVFRRR